VLDDWDKRSHCRTFGHRIIIRNEAAAGFAELDRCEGIRGTPDEIMDRINEELGITAK